MNGAAVPQFLSPGNTEQVYTCGHMHLLLIGLIRSVACLLLSCFVFVFEAKLFLKNLPVTCRALALNPEQLANQNSQK